VESRVGLVLVDDGDGGNFFPDRVAGASGNGYCEDLCGDGGVPRRSPSPLPPWIGRRRQGPGGRGKSQAVHREFVGAGGPRQRRQEARASRASREAEGEPGPAASRERGVGTRLDVGEGRAWFPGGNLSEKVVDARVIGDH
jgi:hypothetical protein